MLNQNDVPQTLKLTNGGLISPDDLSKALIELADWLNEHNSVFECDCEDYEEPKGYMESDTGAYIHSDECPTNYEHHFDIIIRSAANIIKEYI